MADDKDKGKKDDKDKIESWLDKAKKAVSPEKAVSPGDNHSNWLAWILGLGIATLVVWAVVSDDKASPWINRMLLGESAQQTIDADAAIAVKEKELAVLKAQKAGKQLPPAAEQTGDNEQEQGVPVPGSDRADSDPNVGRCTIPGTIFVPQVNGCVEHVTDRARIVQVMPPELENDPMCEGKPPGHHYDKKVPNPRNPRRPGIAHIVCGSRPNQ